MANTGDEIWRFTWFWLDAHDRSLQRDLATYASEPGKMGSRKGRLVPFKFCRIVVRL